MNTELTLLPTIVIADNQRRNYLININGETIPASYNATTHPIDNQGPLVTVTYGPIDESPKGLVIYAEK